MYPKKFDYFVPGSLNEAIKLLHDNEDSKVLAGGQSLLALMKLRLAAPASLVDITQIKDELAYIRKENDVDLNIIPYKGGGPVNQDWLM